MASTLDPKTMAEMIQRMSDQIDKDAAQQVRRKSDPVWTPEAMKNAISVRLRSLSTYRLPFAFLECCKLKNDVAVFVVTDEDSKPVTILDGADLFPSDTLVTQLRVLAK